MGYRNGLTEKEKKIWDEACALFEEMLDDFNSKNLLRKGTLHMDRERLALVWENSRNYGMAFNELYKKFEPKQAKDFAQKAGLTKQTLTYLFISQMISTLLVYLESVFRTSLLFFLEEEYGIKKNMTLGQLLVVIKRVSPSIGTKVESMINTELRNCLAHGTFWFKGGGRVFLATNSYLEEVREITLSQLWIEVRRISIIAIAFVHTLNKKVKQGYFRL